MNRPYAEVIGDPIAQSKSPAIHGLWLEALGIEAEYRTCHVRPEGLADYLALRRADTDWRGCNVTMPHKQAVMALLDQIDPAATRIGAVNTIVREHDGLAGYNTDAPGFLEPLAGRVPGSVTVIGAGGAARAVLVALRDAGARRIALLNRSPDKAAALLEELGLDELGPNAVAGDLDAATPAADLLVNTSAMGMTGHPPLPPAMLSRVAEGGTVYDIVTSPARTALLEAAGARGLETIDGLAMLIGQADHAFRRFFGALPPRERDGELRARLGA